MIKKYLCRIAGLLAVPVMAFSCAEAFDDSSLSGKIVDLENRVSNLEELCRRMNTDISSLQQLVNASHRGLYIVSVTPFADGGRSGYNIVFSDNSSIIVYNGKDGSNGSDGKDGTDGKDGVTPVIGISKDTDGVYYWTINGEWMLDNAGNKVKAVGTDGKDGADGANGTDGADGANGEDGKDGANGKDGVTPKFKIEEGYWFVSYDNGTSWEKLGIATGADGGASGGCIFASIDTSDSNKVVFVLSGGQTVVIPTWAAFDALEKQCEQLNTNLSSMQTILSAIQDRDYVVSVTPVMENGVQTGYMIVFANAGSVTIYNGNDGANGSDGADGSTPLIGVRKDTDGIYYWTVNGEWLLDEAGNKVSATGTGNGGSDGSAGSDGADGKDGVTPKFKIETGKWFVSYDEGLSWTELGQATGDPGKDGQDGANGSDGQDGKDGADGQDGDSFFKSVTQDDMYVYLTMADGTVYTIPKQSAFSIALDTDDVRFSLGLTYYIGYTLTGAGETASITVFTSDGLKARVEKTDATTGNIVITAPSSIVERSTVAVILSDGYGRTYTKAINFIYEGINDIENGVLVITTAEPLSFKAEGGELAVPVQTNMNYTVEVESNSSSWLSYVPLTKAASLRDEEIHLSAAANPGTARHGFVYLVDVSDRSIIQTLCITQEADSEYISETVTFADPNFKSFILSAYDSDSDGAISREEALAIKSLVISNKSISSLSGIEYFTNLEILDCSGNAPLASIDLSKNTALRTLNCSGNTSLASLNLSKNVVLETLDCSNTKVVSLNLSSNIALESVKCGSNSALQSLILGKQDNLKTVVCSSTGISSLDLSKCPSLRSLDCSSTKLSEIGLGSNYELGTVNLNSCAWTLIDLGSIPYVKELNIGYLYSSAGLTVKGEALTSIQIEGSDIIDYIDCRSCPNLVKYSYSYYRSGDNTPIHNLSGLKKLKDLYVRQPADTQVLLNETGSLESVEIDLLSSYTLQELDLTGNPHIKSLSLDVTTVSGNFDISGLDELETLTISFAVTLPQLTSKVLKTINLSECLNESLDFSLLSSLQSLTLSHFANLTTLKLPSSSVLSKIGLSYMDALASLDLSRQTELSEFSCNYGRCMDNLDFSRNLKLGTLTLESIKGLQSLNLGDNKLVRTVEIDNYRSDYLQDVKIKGNNITKFLSNKVCPDLSECPMLMEVGMANLPYGHLDFTKNPKLVSLNCYSGYGGSFGPGQASSIDVSGCAFLKTLKCDNNKIESLKLTGCSGLQTLSCYNNLLETLDLSDCTSLTKLECYSNNLQTLDVSSNTKLTSLDCSPMDWLATLYVSAAQSINYITYNRSDSYIPEATEIVVR